MLNACLSGKEEHEESCMKVAWGGGAFTSVKCHALDTAPTQQDVRYRLWGRISVLVQRCTALSITLMVDCRRVGGSAPNHARRGFVQPTIKCLALLWVNPSIVIAP